MEIKKCKKCEVLKPITEFGKHKITKDGLRTICKICNSNYSKEYYKDNSETIKEYYKDNSEIIKQKSKSYYYNNIENIKETSKKYREENILNIKEKQKEWVINNPNYKKEWNNKNPEYYKEYNEQYKQIRNEKTKERKKIDPVFNLRCYMNRMINSALKKNGFTKKSRSHEILGCSYEYFKQHIESLWESWMTWDNRGIYNGTKNYGWDIDHIIPQSKAMCEDELIKLNHYTNLKPLCGYINRVIKRDN
jgi:hypothetical protein